MYHLGGSGETTDDRVLRSSCATIKEKSACWVKRDLRPREGRKGKEQTGSQGRRVKEGR